MQNGVLAVTKRSGRKRRQFWRLVVKAKSHDAGEDQASSKGDQPVPEEKIEDGVQDAEHKSPPEEERL